MKSLDAMKKAKQDNFPKWLIIHHSGGSKANPLEDTSNHTFETIQAYHINGLGFENIGYNYVIEKDGKLRAGRPETYHGAHTVGYNKKSIGICLTGNFDLTEPTKEQVDVLKRLMKEIIARWNIPLENIVPHRTFANKSCYGNNLPDDWARNLLKPNCIPNEVGALVKALLAKINPK